MKVGGSRPAARDSGALSPPAVTVGVETPGQRASYQVHIGGEALLELPGLLAGLFPGHRAAGIADSGALGFHGERFRAALPPGAPLIEVPAGEEHKSRAQKERLEDALLSHRLGRDSVIVGFGGGVALDLAGFVAATYLRGVPFAAVPTTLLAAVDASVGGKTGVDTPRGKNLIGLIRQPAAVLSDTSLLGTLPDRELRNGLAEAFKMAATSDGRLFAEIEQDLPTLLRREPGGLARLVAASVRIKAAVVAADEREGGLRQVLNFGHTIGHALEHATGYRLPHGMAVGIGMIAESRMARTAGFLDASEEERLGRLLAAAGLPGRAPAEASREQVLSALASDKKTRCGEARFVLLEAIGRVRCEENGGRTTVSFPLSPEVVDSGLSAIGL